MILTSSSKLFVIDTSKTAVCENYIVFLTLVQCISVNQYLRHDLGYKKIQVMRHKRQLDVE